MMVRGVLVQNSELGGIPRARIALPIPKEFPLGNRLGSSPFSRARSLQFDCRLYLPSYSWSSSDRA